MNKRQSLMVMMTRAWKRYKNNANV